MSFFSYLFKYHSRTHTYTHAHTHTHTHTHTYIYIYIYGTRFNHECRCEYILSLNGSRPSTENTNYTVRHNFLLITSEIRYCWSDDIVQWTVLINLTVSQCTLQQQWSHMCTYLLQSGALWDLWVWFIWQCIPDINRIAISLHVFIRLLQRFINQSLIFSSHCPCMYNNCIQYFYQSNVSCWKDITRPHMFTSMGSIQRWQ